MKVFRKSQSCRSWVFDNYARRSSTPHRTYPDKQDHIWKVQSQTFFLVGLPFHYRGLEVCTSQRIVKKVNILNSWHLMTDRAIWVCPYIDVRSLLFYWKTVYPTFFVLARKQRRILQLWAAYVSVINQQFDTRCSRLRVIIWKQESPGKLLISKSPLFSTAPIWAGPASSCY